MLNQVTIKGHLLLLFVAIALISCSNDDSSADNMIILDFVDDDGDGVENTIETNSGTDPNNPCSYLPNAQDFVKTTTAWRNLDCDGDGVPNGKELDPDNNNTNDGNGTDPFDECSLDVNFQSLPPSQNWLDLDCDADCKTNRDELADGTNLLDVDDFVGSGNYIMEVISNDLEGIPFERYFFNQNGSKITEIKNGDDITLYEYVYENNLIKEIHTFSEQGFSVTDVIFEYVGNQITSFTIDFVGNLDEYTVEYDGAFITAHHSGEPPGLFWRRLELDPTLENVIKAEWYRNSNAEYIYTVTDYTFDGMGNRTSYTTEELGYDPVTGDYYPFGDYPITGKTYEYSETVLNPMYEAYKPLEIPAFLSQYGLKNPMESPTSPNLCSHYILDLGYNQFEYNYEINCVQSNGNPIEVSYINQFGNESSKRQFIYE